MDLAIPQQAFALVCEILFWTLRSVLAFPIFLCRNAIRDHCCKPVLQHHPGAQFYVGQVLHTRRKPVANSFRYNVRVAVIDLDNPPPWFSKQAADHMSAQQARDFAQTSGGVKLLTNPTSAGYIQNPISVYYCYDTGGWLVKCVAEVTNTPWAERVTFVFDPKQQVVQKSLHVSPFMDMGNVWHLHTESPGDKLKLSVVVTHPEYGQYFDAHLVAAKDTARPHAPNEAAGLGVLLRYGLMPQRTALWIYLQAIKLFAKGCPVFGKPHPAYREKVQQAASNPVSGSGERFVWRAAQQWPWYKD